LYVAVRYADFGVERRLFVPSHNERLVKLHFN
jgi:hypothetical protein